MKESVYIETTIVSYLTATSGKRSPAADDIAATKKWWDQYRSRYVLYTSAVVITEASRGNPQAAAARLAILNTINEVVVTSAAESLAELLVKRHALPAKANVDALHVAVAASAGANYLLTWNCHHLANATLRSKIEKVCRERGFEPPIICTPKELIKVQT